MFRNHIEIVYLFFVGGGRRIVEGLSTQLLYPKVSFQKALFNFVGAVVTFYGTSYIFFIFLCFMFLEIYEEIY